MLPAHFNLFFIPHLIHHGDKKQRIASCEYLLVSLMMLLGNLLEGPKTVSELVELCEASQSQISHFLMRLKLEGLVKAEREGRFVRYSVADKRLMRLMRVIQTEYCKY